MIREQLILDTLTRLDIPFEMHEHEPLFTVEQAEAVKNRLPGSHAKNLLLKDKKKKLWLIVMDPRTQVSIKQIGSCIGAKELSFAKPELLMEVFGVEPGSVTPFGIVNDEQQRVHILLDLAIFKNKVIGFHPLRNNATIFIAPNLLEAFVKNFGTPFTIVDFNISE